MEEFKIRITGTRPVLFHNAAELVNPFSDVNKKKKTLTSKKVNKTEDDMIEIARLEWAASWYFDQAEGPTLPAQCLLGSFLGAARQNRQGKLVERGVTPGFLSSAISYNGPRDLVGLWGNGLAGSPFVDYRPVGQQTSMVMRCRPILAAGWSVDSTWYVDTSTIDLETFQQIVARAGQTEGVGDFRKMYGRFEAQFI